MQSLPSDQANEIGPGQASAGQPKSKTGAWTISRNLIWGGLALIVVVRFLALGAYPLMDPTEGRYAEISREMATSGNWIVPQFEPGIPFWGKPPVTFWATAAAYTVFGFSEFSSRLPMFLFHLIAAGVMYRVARDYRGPEFALLSMAVLGTTALFYAYAGFVATDPSLLFCLTLAMSAFYFAMRSETRSGSMWFGYAFAAALGLTLLSKGLVGWVLIFASIGMWALWNGRVLDLFRRLPVVSGLVLSLIIAVPWHILCEQQSPGFLEYYVIGEHFKRFTEPEWTGDLYGDAHSYPRGMIWVFWFLTALPWSFLFIVAAIKTIRSRKKLIENEWDSYFLFWFLMPLVFFTFSRNIMFTYVLPIIPPFAILVTRLLISFRSEPSVPWFAGLRPLASVFFLVPVLFAIAAFTVIPSVGDTRSQRDLIRHFDELNAANPGGLIYTDEMPYSGDFYSEGLATDIPDESTATMRLHLSDLDVDYYVIEEGDLDEFPVEGFSQTEEVGRFGEYVLRREKKAEGHPFESDLSELPELELKTAPKPGPLSPLGERLSYPKLPEEKPDKK